MTDRLPIEKVRLFADVSMGPAYSSLAQEVLDHRAAMDRLSVLMSTRFRLTTGEIERALRGDA